MSTQQFPIDTKGDAIVYVRPVEVANLPKKLQAEVEGAETLYALHREDGSPLALVKDRSTAFLVARENDLTPVSVH